MLAYVFFAIMTRALGGRDAAPVAQLWAWWAATGAVLTLPVQHWVIRLMHLAAGDAILRRAVPRVGMVVAALAGIVALGSPMLREQLFTRGDAAFPLLAAAVTCRAFVVVVAWPSAWRIPATGRDGRRGRRWPSSSGSRPGC